MNFLKLIITILKLIQLGKNKGANTSFSYLKLVLQYMPMEKFYVRVHYAVLIKYNFSYSDAYHLHIRCSKFSVKYEYFSEV